jgi:hypothetical protein
MSSKKFFIQMAAADEMFAAARRLPDTFAQDMLGVPVDAWSEADLKTIPGFAISYGRSDDGQLFKRTTELFVHDAEISYEPVDDCQAPVVSSKE